MDKKTSPQTLLIAAALSLLVALVLIIAYMVPKINTLKDLNQTIVQKQQELDLGKQKVQAVRDAVQLLQQAKKEIEVLNIAMPTKEKAEESLLQVSEIASKQEIEITSATFAEDKTSGSQQLTMSLTTRGAYNKFVDFFNAVNTNLRPAVASGINFSPNEEKGLEASFDLTFPYISPSADKSAAASGTATTEGGQSE